MRLSHHRCLRWLCNVLLALALSTPVLAQQPGPIQYVYDELGRLVKVIDAAGNMAEYVYDKVGNILEIRRSTVTGLALFDFAPRKGLEGTTVTLQGLGFRAVPSENTVTFNGTVAPVTSATSTRLVVQIPLGATTGPLAITVAGQTATAGQDFFLLPAIKGLQPTAALPGTTIVNLQVQGTNLTGSTFTFVPALTPSACAVTAATITPTGTSAILQVAVNTNALGPFVLIATNAVGSSSTVPSASNTLRVLDPNGDADNDGLSNRDEFIHGTDPLKSDTDGDGFPDVDEVLLGSDPTDPRSKPVLLALAQAAPVAYLNGFVADSDHDGVADVDEVALGTDPNNPASQPAITVQSAVVSYQKSP